MYLNCHSYFSLCYGTLSVERLVEEAIRKGVTAMALTDINNSTGVLDFFSAALKGDQAFGGSGVPQRSGADVHRSCPQ